MLVDEIANRCGLRLPISTIWPASGPVIAITSERQVAGWKRPIPVRPGGAESRVEGYRLFVEQPAASPIVWIAGADARGALFGAGRLLRELDRATYGLALRSISRLLPHIPSVAINSAIGHRQIRTMPGTPHTSRGISAN
jgi:hypothetical protein